MHRHYCDFAGHDSQCTSENCECVCGMPMEGHDHRECPVELRPCPEHEAETAQSIAEAVASEPNPELIPQRRERLFARYPCECGCAEIDIGKISGFCLWCDHVYAQFSPTIQDFHFAKHCAGAPEQLSQSAWARLVKH
jgi:hypothetical protein